MKEIKILGAGISGLTAAINLAKAGYDAKVFEKNRMSENRTSLISKALKTGLRT